MTRKPKTTQKARPPASPTISAKANSFDALAAASALALALPVEAAWQAGIAQNLRLLFHHASLVDELSLPDDTEPAPVFRA